MTTYTVQIWRYNGTETHDDWPSQLMNEHRGLTSEADLLSVLDQHRVISPTAYDMPILDVIHQVNNVNGGELVVLVDGVRYGIA